MSDKINNDKAQAPTSAGTKEQTTSKQEAPKAATPPATTPSTDKTQGGKLDGNGNPVTPVKEVQDQNPAENAASDVSTGAKGVSATKEGRTRVWAELWLTSEDLAILEALATEKKVGRREFASNLANEILPAKLQELGAGKAEDLRKAKEEAEKKKAEASEKSKKAEAERVEKAKKLLMEKGLLPGAPAEGAKAESMDPTEQAEFLAWKAQRDAATQTA